MTSALARAVAVLLVVGCLLFTSDGLGLNTAERAASPHLYSLVGWELGNFLDKWLKRASSIFAWNSLTSDAKARLVGDFFALSATRSEIAARLDDAVSRGATDAEIDALEAQLDALDRSRLQIRPEVEEALEAAISSVLASEGLSLVGEVILPPVDFSLTSTPYVLVTSPRDRIERGEEALLKPDMSLSESMEIEEFLLNESNLSALVLPIGGLATYPATVYGDAGLRWTLQTAAHEWLHHRLFFRPLGFRMTSSSRMFTLNETVANVAGKELGDRAFVLLGGELPPFVHLPEPAPNVANPHAPDMAHEFDFRAEMQITRLHTDELLAEGRTEAAEAYMEFRRLLFVEHGFNIRKLNQAYFAFHGTYADSAASSSPIGDQVREYRNLSASLGSFISAMESMGSYEEFLKSLEDLRASTR